MKFGSEDRPVRSVARNLRRIRLERGYTQEQLAVGARIGSRTVARIEQGESPRISTLEAIAEVLDCTLEDLIREAA